MKTAGYSGTPLYKKLGIKAGSTVLLINTPKEYEEWLGPDCPAFKPTNRGGTPVDFVHLFTNSAGELQAELTRLKNQINPDGMVWVN